MADEPEIDEGREPIDGPGPITLTSRKSSLEEPYRKGEAETVEWVESLFSDADQGREDQCDTGTWDKGLDVFWGDQWVGAIPSYKPRIVVNEIKSLLLQELSDLTDSRLTVYVQKNRQDTTRDAAVEGTIQTFWKSKYCDMVVLCAALDAMIYPLGFLQSGIDPMGEQGQGEVLFKHRDPITVFPDPDAEWDPSTG